MADTALRGPILIISGTNRPNANALRVAHVLLEHYRRAEMPIDLFSLAEMTPEIFSPTSYATKPPKMVEIQQRIVSAAGLHIVSPEYNGSFPGVLKYCIDMLKFPESFEAKPVAFVGESNGIWGGLRPVEQLSQIFAYRNAHIFPLRVFIPGVSAKFDAQGKLIDNAINERLEKQAIGFATFVQHFPMTVQTGTR
jgi:NAD(P)H-dependent FMN reductase